MEAIWIIRWAFFAIYTACYAVIFYATWRQYSLYKRTTEIPAKYANLVSNEQFKKERRNEMEKLRFDMLFLALRWLLLIPFLFFGLLFFLWTSSKNLCHFFGFENEYFYSIMFVWLVHTLQMPLNLFNTLFNELIIQRKYKESNEEMENGNVEKTSKCFSVLKILGKQFLIYTICIPLGVCAFLAAVRFFGPNNFWLVAFISLNIGLYATLFFMDYLMPFIFPKQYGQLPMHECELKKNIEKLCAQENVKISGVFISKKANTEVAFMGYWTWSTRKKLVLDEIFLDIGFLKKVYEFNGKKYDEENDGTVEEGNTKINGKEKETNVAINDANTKEENTVAPLLPQIVNENEEKIKKINEKNVENKNKIEETDEEFVLNDEEIMGMVAAEIGLYKLKTGIRDRIIHRINHLCLELLPLLIFQFTYQSEMIFSAFHVPPTEYYPPIVGSWFAISLFVWPAFELYSGILTFRRVFMEDHVRAKSAIQLGYGKEYRAGLVKFWTEIGIELGDWLYRLLQRGQWERMPTDLDELDKILAAKEELWQYDKNYSRMQEE